MVRFGCEEVVLNLGSDIALSLPCVDAEIRHFIPSHLTLGRDCKKRHNGIVGI